MDPEDVDVTEVTVDDDGKVEITYQISGLDPLDQIVTEKTVESEGVASDIADGLQEVRIGHDMIFGYPLDTHSDIPSNELYNTTSDTSSDPFSIFSCLFSSRFNIPYLGWLRQCGGGTCRRPDHHCRSDRHP